MTDLREEIHQIFDWAESLGDPTDEETINIMVQLVINLGKQLAAEKQTVRVLREAIEAALPVLDGPEYRVLEHALATTEPEDG